jgi:recombination protein RecT
MSELQKNQNQLPATGIKGISQFLNSESIKSKFTEILGQKGVGFISSVLSVVSSNSSLSNADQNSIYTAALMAASLDLPINQNLGLAYIVPYNAKQSDGTYKQMAQFQLGYKGFLQLAQRSGQFKTINSTDVRDGEIVSWDRMSGEITFEWIQDSKVRLSKKVVGYLSYFKLLNGFENSLYMTVEEIDAHAKKYSQTYKKYGTGLWRDEFEGMAKKTVTKLNLSKNAPLSIEMSKAVISDQSVIKNDKFVDEETVDIDTQYVDNEEVVIDVIAVNKTSERERVKTHIEKSKTLEQLAECLPAIADDDDELIILYADKKRELTDKKK